MRIIKIQYTGADGGTTFRARDANEPGRQEYGANPAEALGKMFISWPELFSNPQLVQDLPNTFPQDPKQPLAADVSAFALGSTAITYPALFQIKIDYVQPQYWPNAIRKRAGLELLPSAA